MNAIEMGQRIRELRTEQKLTQAELAKRLNVSDKAVSKWERGQGCPDVAILPYLTEVLGADAAGLLSPKKANPPVSGNLLKTRFFVCPVCGNILTGTTDASVCCCGKRLSPVAAKRADEAEKLRVERIESEWYVSSDHAMTKSHYISFLAFLTGDTVILKKLYPEWSMEARIPTLRHGKLVWYCTEHGLFEQLV